MDLNQFFKLTDSLELFGLSKKQYMEKTIQIADLLQFVACQHFDIEILNCSGYKVFIVKIDNEWKGITFFDIENTKTKYQTCKLILQDESEIVRLKSFMRVSDLWFIFVHESRKVNYDYLSDFISRYSLKSFYNKICLFDYHKLTTKELI